MCRRWSIIGSAGLSWQGRATSSSPQACPPPHPTPSHPHPHHPPPPPPPHNPPCRAPHPPPPPTSTLKQSWRRCARPAQTQCTPATVGRWANGLGACRAWRVISWGWGAARCGHESLHSWLTVPAVHAARRRPPTATPCAPAPSPCLPRAPQASCPRTLPLPRLWKGLGRRGWARPSSR